MSYPGNESSRTERNDGHDADIEQELANYYTGAEWAHEKYNPTVSNIPVVS
jgi:hypothetical protein